jgi:hypothetical protein
MTMIRIHTMMLKTHPLLTTHVRSVHFDGQTRGPSSKGEVSRGGFGSGLGWASGSSAR